MISRLRLKFIGLFILLAIAAGVAHTSEIFTASQSENTTVTNHTVEIKELVFSPKTLKVKPGDTITWTNLDMVPHTATSLSGSWDSGSLKMGESFTLTISDGMQLDYFCAFHPMMKANIEIN